MKHRVLSSMMACAGLALIGVGLVAAAPNSANTKVYSPNSNHFGQSYAVWSGEANVWGLELPTVVPQPACNPSGPSHPYLDCPDFDVTMGQSGKVWYLTTAGAAAERTCTIPKGKALFCLLAAAEASSVEDPDGGFYGATAAEQAAVAEYWADHIVVGSLLCELDGKPVTNLGAFRFLSPQFTFSAPDPWVFGPAGAGETGTTVVDGYCVILKKLNAGQHVLQFGGTFHFAIADGDPFDFDLPLYVTYHLTQLGGGGNDGDEDDGDD